MNGQAICDIYEQNGEDTMNRRLFTSESVTEGHPDKICDTCADAILDAIMEQDPYGRVACEVCTTTDFLLVMGEISTTAKVDYEKVVRDAVRRIGYTNPDIGFDADSCEVMIRLDTQSPDIAMGVDKALECKSAFPSAGAEGGAEEGAGDQGMMFGYACNETPELLPIPYVLATRFLELLKNYPTRMLKADAKAQVSYDYDSGRITTFLCSVQHVHDVEVEDFRPIIENLMIRTATEYGLNTDFEKLVNPTGRFVLGSSFADCGVTGRKLACDTYGGIGHIGGGAMSGKDPSKVDRSGAYAARKIARDIVSAGYADKAEVQIAYAIGIAEPVSVYVETFGTEHQDTEFINQYVRENYDLTPRGIIEGLHLLDVDYNAVSAYGHFGKSGLPWEK